MPEWKQSQDTDTAGRLQVSTNVAVSANHESTSNIGSLHNPVQIRALEDERSLAADALRAVRSVEALQVSSNGASVTHIARVGDAIASAQAAWICSRQRRTGGKGARVH